jgi:hypothetical protein
METEIVIIFFLLLSWFLFSIFCGVWASYKGRSGVGYFFLSFLLSPMLGFIAVTIRKRNEELVKEKR